MNNLNQQLARRVYDKISGVNAAGKSDDYKRKYGKMALKLPALVQNAGLLQSFAFIEDNKEAPSQELLRDLACVLGFEDKAALMTACIDLPFAGYRYLTHRCVIALTWFKRFSQSTWRDSAAEDDDD